MSPFSWLLRHQSVQWLALDPLPGHLGSAQARGTGMLPLQFVAEEQAACPWLACPPGELGKSSSPGLLCWVGAGWNCCS